jgi:hypothetical protein
MLVEKTPDFHTKVFIDHYSVFSGCPTVH